MLELRQKVLSFCRKTICLLMFHFLMSERSGSVSYMRRLNMFIFSFNFRIVTHLHSPNSRILEAMPSACIIIL